MAITQKQVAELAKVSQAAVSLALSPEGRHTLSKQTVDAVEAAARQLGYRANRAAQALKSGRTLTIGCVVPDLTNPFYPSLIRGVRETVEAHDYDIIIYDTEGLPDREQRFIDWAQAGRIDGVIGAFFYLRVPDFLPLIDGGISISRIEISKEAGGALPVDNVYVDNRAASVAAADFLLNKNYTSLGIVSGPGEPSAVRVKGFVDRARNRGAQIRMAMAKSLNEEGGFSATCELISSVDRPRAIFAVNDYMAIGALHALHSNGVRVPEEIAVIGFDDIPVASLAYPSLTTVSQPQVEIGRCAAQCLLSRLVDGKGGPGTAHELAFKIVERKST